jgi:hypothetical protein
VTAVAAATKKNTFAHPNILMKPNTADSSSLVGAISQPAALADRGSWGFVLLYPNLGEPCTTKLLFTIFLFFLQLLLLLKKELFWRVCYRLVGRSGQKR